MNLICKNEKGFWKPTKESLATVQQCKSQMVLQYQKQCLELSKQALESKDNSRDMTTFTFAVSKNAQKKIENAVFALCEMVFAFSFNLQLLLRN